jgi:ferredoxin-NADP reductase
MSILRHFAAVGSAVRVALLYAARTWDDVIFREELIALDEARSDFTLLLSLSRDTPRRPQDTGRRIDSAQLEVTLAKLGAAPQLTFVCGSNPFVETVTGHLVDLKLRPETIRTERFGG